MAQERQKSQQQTKPEERQSITLTIAARSYSMKIQPQDEERYRLAEQMINRLMSMYQSYQVDGYSMGDYLAITALNLAVENIRNSQSREVGDDVLRLRKILDEVNGTLSEK